MKPDKEGHRASTFNDLARFTVNEDGAICLDGRPIETKKVVLERWQGRVLAICGAIVAAVQLLTWLGIKP